MLDRETKNNLRIFGTFLGTLTLMTGILVAATALAKGPKDALLALDVQRVLDRYEPGGYAVGSAVELRSAFSTSAAAYSLSRAGAEGGEPCFGVIVRIPTIFGPMPAVFVCSGAEPAAFAGYAVDAAKAMDLDSTRLSRGVLGYWQRTIPKILARRQSDGRQ